MKRTRWWLRWGVTALLGVTFVPIINLNVERLAEQKGWDQFLSSNWAVFVSAMSSIAEHPFFLVVVGIAIGGTLFMWVDYFMRRPEQGARCGAAVIERRPRPIEPHQSEQAQRPVGPKENEVKVYLQTDLQSAFNIVSNNTGLQAKQYINEYTGKWIKLTGDIYDVTEPVENQFIVYMTIKFGERNEKDIDLEFSEMWKEQLISLERGKIIMTAEGRIARFTRSTLTLENCEIISIDRKN